MNGGEQPMTASNNMIMLKMATGVIIHLLANQIQVVTPPGVLLICIQYNYEPEISSENSRSQHHKYNIVQCILIVRLICKSTFLFLLMISVKTLQF